MTPSNPSSPRSRSVSTTCESVAGTIAIERLDHDMRAHHDRNRTGSDRVRERNEVARAQRRGAGGDARQRDVRITGRRAVARKVFRRRRDSGAFEPARERTGECGDGRRLVAVGARRDHRAARLQREIGDRRQIDADPEPRQIAPQQPAEPFGEVDVAGRADRHRGRQRGDAVAIRSTRPPSWSTAIKGGGVPSARTAAISSRSSPAVPTLRAKRISAPGPNARSASSGAVAAVMPPNPTPITPRASTAGSVGGVIAQCLMSRMIWATTFPAAFEMKIRTLEPLETSLSVW